MVVHTLCKLFAAQPKRRNKRLNSSPCAAVESLENRKLLSATSGVKAFVDNATDVQAELFRGQLVVVGTSGNDTIKVNKSGANVKVVGTNSNGTKTFLFKLTDVKRISVAGEAGNDRISIASALKQRSWLFGGSGKDRIHGGSGRDDIYGGLGKDVLNGRGGNDTIYGGPAKNRDVLKGGSGKNRLFRRSPGRKANLNNLEQQVFRLINIERRKFGLRPLLNNSKLNSSAQDQANQMSRLSRNTTDADALQHIPDGSRRPTLSSRVDYAGFEWKSIAENIAFGFNSAQDVVNAWLGSAPHRANILSSQFTSMGIGFTKSSNGTFFWAMHFADKA